MNPATPSVVAIFGPTASGKSALVAALLEQLDAEAVSADSAAIYADLPILTAAPEHPAHLVGTVALSDEISVADFQSRAHEAIDDILHRHKTAIVVGGTGLYFRAALSAMSFPPAPPAELREHWNAHYDEHGPDASHELLTGRDPHAAAQVHANDRKRVVRALELTDLGSSLAPQGASRLWTDDVRHPTQIVALDCDAITLDERIAARTVAMVEAGAVAEASAAWQQPLSATARKILGLEQFATLPVAEAVEAVTLATRQLARYQRKWLRRTPVVGTLEATRTVEELAHEVVSLAGTGKHLSRG